MPATDPKPARADPARQCPDCWGIVHGYAVRLQDQGFRVPSFSGQKKLKRSFLKFWDANLVRYAQFQRIHFPRLNFSPSWRDNRRIRMDPWEPLEYVGETLVFLGVIGEVFAEWKEPHRKKLAKASSIVLIVGLALSLAALIGTNEHFNGTIAQLNLQASQAIERAAVNEKDAALQRLRADKDEKELLKLQRATLPRTLDPEKVASKISGFGHIGTASCVPGDLEPQHVWALIQAALDTAGWTGPGVPSAGAGGSGLSELSTPGVWIEVSPMAPTSPGPTSDIIVKHSEAERAKELRRLNRAADALVSALNSEGVETKKRPLSARPTGGMPCPTIPDAIRILVGLRPMPDLDIVANPK